MGVLKRFSRSLDGVGISDLLSGDNLNKRYYEENRGCLAEEYPGETIAILDGGSVIEVLEESGWPEIEGEMDRLELEYGNCRAASSYVVDVPER